MMQDGKSAEYNYIRMGVVMKPEYMEYKRALSTVRVVTVGGVFINTLRAAKLTVYYSDVLDWYHGIDLIVTNGKCCITIDFSTYHKPDYKADLLMIISSDDGVVEQKRNAELIIRKLGGVV
jgi:hypothetical protein